MKQKVETYINKDLWEIEYNIKNEIAKGWLVVAMMGEDNIWLVVYQQQDLIPQ